jgi:hypothetical protein
MMPPSSLRHIVERLIHPSAQKGILGSSAILASFATIGADAPVGSVGKGGPTVSAEENKAMLRRLVDEGLNAGNMDVVEELFNRTSGAGTSR